MRRWFVLFSALALVGGALAVAPASAATRAYWIAADEVLWDYAPSYPTNLMTGAPFTPEQEVFVNDFIGRKYTKSLYREYTPHFAALKPRGPAEEHLGLLGPVIRAAVGDTIVVHFKNNTTFPATMHPHGVRYDKASEGAPYDDGTGGADKADDFVMPGGQHTYVWEVPRRAGPGPSDPSSIGWLYHSHAHEPADTNGGLVGPIVITRRGYAKPDGSPANVDREFFSLFTVFDENASVHIDNNNTVGADLDDEDFQESNLMHGINGLVYGNNTGYAMRVGEKVRWYIIGMGTEVDLHTPHWHGVTLLHHGARLDVAKTLPATTDTYDLRPDNPGTWMFHCHVNDHIEAGMMTTFKIQ